MDEKKVGAGAPRVGGVAGLVGVMSEGHYFIGKINEEKARILAADHNYGPGYICLEEAYRLQYQYQARPEGTIVQMAPVPVPPFQGPTQVTVHVGAIVDLSGEAEMAQMHRAMTGDSGILLPKGMVR